MIIIYHDIPSEIAVRFPASDIESYISLKNWLDYKYSLPVRISFVLFNVSIAAIAAYFMAEDFNYFILFSDLSKSFFIFSLGLGIIVLLFDKKIFNTTSQILGFIATVIGIIASVKKFVLKKSGTYAKND